MPRFFKKNLFPLLLISLAFLIAFLNYTPDTFLTGWDTLHPELDFSLNFKRLIFGVWRTEQGLGALAAHAHMADLPRVFLLWLFHFILPLSTLRYAYIFLCLLLGPLGVFYLAKFIFKKLPVTSYQLPVTSFLASLFYLFNLSTLQQFAVPFEMFPTQYAFLPWIILYSLKYLQKPTQKSLFLFSIITLLSTPQAYAAHLWYAFFVLYLCFLALYSLLHQNSLKKSLRLILLTLILNSFWLLPNLYFIRTNASVPQNAKVNQLYSQEFLLKNRQTGYLDNVALQKGFYFNWKIYNHNTSRFEELLAPWQQHLQKPFVQFIGFFLFFLSFSGLILILIKKQKELISFIPFFLLPFILLLNSTPPFKQFLDFLIKFPLLNEAFRFIFTKISLSFTFALSLFFAFFIHSLFTLFKKTKIKISLSLVLIFSLFYFCLPYFQSQLISKKMRVSFPYQYSELWQFMKNEPSGIVLPLPLHNFTGWQYYNWGYQGAGFIWFGLPQPILDRDFDRWSLYNQQAYQDFFQALYAKNPFSFYQNLQKYHVQYIFWDQNIITSSTKNRQQILFKNEIDSLLKILTQSQHLTTIKQIDSLSLFRVNPIASILNQQNKNGSDQNQDLPPIILSDIPIPAEYQENIALISQNLDFQSQNKTVGINLELPQLEHGQSYQFAFKSKNILGLPLRICLKNNYNNICTLYEQLDQSQTSNWSYFSLPTMDNFSGFNLSIENISIGDYFSHNQLEEIIISKIESISPSSNTTLFNVKIPSQIFFTKVKISSSTKEITFPQSFHSGWLAFYFSGLRPVFLKDHTLANNWANSWSLPITSYLPAGRQDPLPVTIYILFWPQLLEFIGFALLVPTLVYLLKKPKNQ
ncbi:hypothetical protein KJ909_00960 [Patescibacteria group bacterium]|nr:hypothetical protein [Patescibacteria group bacterium]